MKNNNNNREKCQTAITENQNRNIVNAQISLARPNNFLIESFLPVSQNEERAPV